ncbi:MAG: tRNA glutamyl-Q(34) synthetase GluQRS [Defluviicoccus sp.]|nr:MAG: tRNA glutamyl-Q(34) synthetase GluQRS [Defluviicoccus sp.]
MITVTRFAPSPTGDLHLGHAFSAWFAHERAASAGGRFFIRIEDIDIGRSRAEYVERNLDDLAWLGLVSDAPPVRQSQRIAYYRQALDRLANLGVLYPCFCTRARIRAEIAAAGAAPQAAADGTLLYPGSCRGLAPEHREELIASGTGYALRLDVERALAITGPLTWTDRNAGEQAADLKRLGDVVIARKDIPTSYHLSVVVDDAAQGVSLVTRGRDLRDATAVHRLLYALLDLPVPEWEHHPLCLDGDGRRLAKRTGAPALRTLRAAGFITPLMCWTKHTEPWNERRTNERPLPPVQTAR